MGEREKSEKEGKALPSFRQRLIWVLIQMSIFWEGIERRK
jgi:hypothetical protein